MTDADGYSDAWHATEAAWSAEPKPECDLVRKARELQAKQPAARKPVIRVNAKAPSRPWEKDY